MQRMFNLDKWRYLAQGEVIRFTSDRPRTVRLEVNAEDKCKFFVAEGAEDPVFLAVVEGRDALEFSAQGEFDLLVTGGSAAIYTADGDDWSVAEVDGATFTKIVERRMRNPELEYMMFVQNQNMEKRLAQQADELQRRFEASAAERDARRVPEPVAQLAAPVAEGGGAATSGASSDPAEAPVGAGAPVAPVGATAAAAGG